MNKECEVIRDLLPLYADEVCSATSAELVEEHLQDCPDCSAMLEKLRTHEIETDLQEEKEQVIEYQAKRFRRRSATVGSVVSGLFMIPILVCLIVNLRAGHGLDWFFVVLAALAVAASLIIVPLIMAYYVVVLRAFFASIPISLIESGTLVIGVLTQKALYEKTVSNMMECKSRGAYLLGITTNGNFAVEDSVNFTVYVPKTDEHFVASLAVVPLQLLAYYSSVNRGLDVDKPRNLAKSVTVE